MGALRPAFLNRHLGGQNTRGVASFRLQRPFLVMMLALVPARTR